MNYFPTLHPTHGCQRRPSLSYKPTVFASVAPPMLDFWATICTTVRPMISDRCLSVCLSVTLVYCGQTVGCIKMPFGMEVDLGPSDFVLRGDPAPPPQRGGGVPKFSAHFYCGQTA